MDANTSKMMAVEAGKVLDALATLKCDIDCHCDQHARSTASHDATRACAAIREAIGALKRMLQMTEQQGARLIVLHPRREVGELVTPQQRGRAT